MLRATQRRWLPLRWPPVTTCPLENRLSPIRASEPKFRRAVALQTSRLADMRLSGDGPLLAVAEAPLEDLSILNRAHPSFLEMRCEVSLLHEYCAVFQ